MALSAIKFEEILSAEFPELSDAETLGVAISGGPDSMALGYLLNLYAQKNGKKVLAVTFDHGLRDGSDAEAQHVQDVIDGWSNTQHEILKWGGDKPDTRIMEEARKARYDAFVQYFKGQGVSYLFLGHHQDDQAETFLIRLSKGSGLDGLTGMRASQPYGDLTLLRPLLDVSKEDLIQVCEENGVKSVDDPSNENENFLRPRLRASRAVLEEEGLTAKRLSNTARRLQSARDALDQITDKVFEESMVERGESALSFDFAFIQNWPYEIGLRVLLKAMNHVTHHNNAGYGPRLEKVESLYGAILSENAILKRTLGGCIIAYDAAENRLTIETE